MSDAERALELADLHGWELRGEPAGEGSAARLPVTTEAGQPALLYAWDDELLASRASAAHELAGAHLFAVPERIASGPHWVLVEDVPGVPAKVYLQSHGAQARKNLVRELGKLSRKLHAAPSDHRCGDILEEEVAAHWLTFSGYVAARLEAFAEQMRHLQFDDTEVEHLAIAIGDLRHELAAFHPRNPTVFVHGRLSFDHVWVDETRGEIVGLTGLERSAFLPAEADLAFLLWIEGVGSDDGLTRALYDGYGAARTMDVQRRERFFRRLVAFESLFGRKGAVPRSRAELIELVGV